MDLQIEIISEDNDYAITQAHQLTKEFDRYVPEAEVIQLKKTMRSDDAAFSILDTVVKVFLGKDFIEKVIDVIKTWIEKRADVINAKKVKIQFDIKDNNGKTISLQLENVKDAEKLIEQLKTSVPF